MKGCELKAIRESLGLSITGFAAQIRMSADRVRGFETGKFDIILSTELLILLVVEKIRESPFETLDMLKLRADNKVFRD